MKVFLRSIIVLLLFVSCKKDKLPETFLQEKAEANATEVKKGEIKAGPYASTAKGTVRLFKNTDGTYAVEFSNLQISNGPDLYVYLSKEQMPINFISLGKLRSTMGNQVYEIPGNPDFNAYKYVVIHCQSYNHLFGFALIN